MQSIRTSYHSKAQLSVEIQPKSATRLLEGGQQLDCVVAFAKNTLAGSIEQARLQMQIGECSLCLCSCDLCEESVSSLDTSSAGMMSWSESGSACVTLFLFLPRAAHSVFLHLLNNGEHGSGEMQAKCSTLLLCSSPCQYQRESVHTLPISSLQSVIGKCQ